MHSPIAPPVPPSPIMAVKKKEYTADCASAGVSNGSSFVFGFRIDADFSAQTFAITSKYVALSSV